MFNFFEKERLHYQPQLPLLLKDIGLLTAEKTELPPVTSAIRDLFPNTFSQPIIHLRIEKGKQEERESLRVGVVLSGGQAPGGHNVIIGIFDALKKISPQARLFGFLDGPSGIIENKILELSQEHLSGYRNTGGFDLIGSGRTKIETQEQLKAAKKACEALALNGLVIIGGDDSNTNAALLAEYFLTHGCKTAVVGVPKTIDGDLKNSYIEASFGFDTACKIYSQMIGNLCRDALSAKKYTHFIKLMGRSASHIALECALQTHPNLTFIGEECAAKNFTLQQITEQICTCITKRAEQGKKYGVILIPEGLIEFIPEMKSLIAELNGLLTKGEEGIYHKLSKEAKATFDYLPKEISEQLLLDRDPHGNVQVSHIATEQLFIHLAKEGLKKRNFKGQFSPVAHFFGYEGRCGYPSNFDATYCYALGFTATALILNGLTGYVSVLQQLTKSAEEWVPAGIPITAMMDLEERKGKMKPVIKKALVDLEGAPFGTLSSRRAAWAFEDHYRFPGPIQFFGVSAGETTFTLKLEQNQHITV
jgi:pyrophosphate--fructose-6-phosphate 1-phosphotransferase